MDLDRFFNPSSVAVVGASPKKGSIGGQILQNLIAQKYPGKIFPVNPNFGSVFGFRCYNDIRQVPKPELSLIAIPAKYVLDEIKAEARAGIRHVVIVSAGFKETGQGGKLAEDEIARIARRNGMRLVGPNCLGIYDNVSRLDTFFLPRDLIRRPPKGTVSLASQSGSFVGHLMDLAAFESLGIARVITYGNQADISESDALRYFADDRDTNLVGLYIEAVKDGKAFLDAAVYCTKKKPLVVLKTGRTPSMSSAITSHTGALTGGYEAYETAFRKANVTEVFSEIEFVDACKAISMVPRAKGNRILIIGHAGGLALTLSDLCLTDKLEIPQVDYVLAKRLREKTLPIASVNNPIDLTASGTDDQVSFVLEECFVKNKEFADLAIYLGVWGLRQTSDDIAEVISSAMSRSGKPILVASIQGKRCIQKKYLFEEKRIPVFLSLERAARAARIVCSRAAQ